MLDWLKDHVPKLAVAVGDTVTGGTVSRIASALGVEVGSADELHQRLKADPKLMRELQQREHELALQELRVRLEDRADARSMHEAVRGWINPTLSMLTVLGFFGALTAFAFVDLPNGGTEVLLIMVGALAQHAGQIYSFHFGSSEGSKRKDIAARIQ